MPEFHIRPNGFQEIKKRLITTMSIMFGIILLVILVLPAIMSDEPTRFDTVLILVPVFIGVFGFSIANSIKKLRPIFESYILKIDDEKIVRQQLNIPELVIYRNEITSITKGVSGGFAIQGKSKLNPIAVPAQIENPQLLEDTLNQIKPVQVRTTKTFIEKMFIPLSLSGAALMAVPMFSTNETINLVSNVLLVILLSACLFVTQKSKNIDKRTKRLSWVVLIPLLAYGSMIVSKLL